MTVRRENPVAELRLVDGRWWSEHIANDPNWIALGYAPRPHTTWQTFRHHVLHGLLMGYRLMPVLAWSWLNRESWRTPPQTNNRHTNVMDDR